MKLQCEGISWDKWNRGGIKTHLLLQQMRLVFRSKHHQEIDIESNSSDFGQDQLPQWLCLWSSTVTHHSANTIIWSSYCDRVLPAWDPNDRKAGSQRSLRNLSMVQITVGDWILRADLTYHFLCICVPCRDKDWKVLKGPKIWKLECLKVTRSFSSRYIQILWFYCINWNTN